MDKIGHIKKLILEALEEREKAGEPFLVHGQINTRLHIKPQDIRDIEEYYIQQLQRSFIEEGKDTAKEIERVERLFSLPFHSIEVPYKNRKGEVITEEGVDTYRYTFKELEDDLNNRTLQPPYGERDGQLIVGHVLAVANYYEWLKEQPQESIKKHQGRLIWNGNNNTLADLFYQLKTNLPTEDGKPLLDASNEALAEFLKANFECFKNTQISTIKEYLERDEKRPKKSKTKLTIVKGFKN